MTVFSEGPGGGLHRLAGRARTLIDRSRCHAGPGDPSHVEVKRGGLGY